MIEYILNTGFGSTGEFFHQKGQNFNGSYSIFNSNALDNDITINGQTLLETLASIQVVGQQEIITNSGQFFLTGGSLKNSTGFLSLGSENINLKYDSNLSGQRFFFEGDTNALLKTGFSGAAGDLNGCSVFLNGVKLSSGIHYTENSNGNFNWIDADTSTTGVLFTAPIRNWYTTTGSYDVLGTKFNEGSSVGYLNGVKIDDSAILETSSLLSGSILTGVNCLVEFSIEQDKNTLFF